jgi:hypothetical protein
MAASFYSIRFFFAKTETPSNSMETLSSLKPIWERDYHGIRLQAVQGALLKPSALLPSLDKAIQSLKFTDFVLGGYWCVPGTSDPLTLALGLKRLGLTIDAIGRESVDTIVLGAGYYENATDWDTGQIHINVSIGNELVATSRLRILAQSTAFPSTTLEKAIAEMRGSFCLSPLFLPGLTQLPSEQQSTLLHQLQEGHLAEWTSFATVFNAVKAITNHLVCPADKLALQLRARAAKHKLLQVFQQAWQQSLLRDIIAAVILEAAKNGAQLLLAPVDLIQLKKYAEVLGYEHPQNLSTEMSLLYQGKTAHKLLEFRRQQGRVVDVGSRADPGEMAIMCMPLHADLVNRAQQVINRYKE